jgi:hypothetical protein
MSRPLPPPTRDQIAPEELDAYDKVIARFRKPGWVAADGEPRPDCHFGSLLHSPPFAALRQDISSMVRTAGERADTYSHADREFVDQVLAAELATNVVQLRHVADGLGVGVRLEAIDALRAGDDGPLSPDERLLATYIRQVVRGTVTDDTFELVRQRMGMRGLVEYTFFITVLQLTMRMYQAFGCPDPPDSEIDELIEGFRSGEAELPDWRSRIR